MLGPRCTASRPRRRRTVRGPACELIRVDMGRCRCQMDPPRNTGLELRRAELFGRFRNLVAIAAVQWYFVFGQRGSGACRASHVMAV
eukprot:scaffold378173_cov41-Prasinocladus_malaysianus.AAC.1